MLSYSAVEIPLRREGHNLNIYKVVITIIPRTDAQEALNAAVLAMNSDIKDSTPDEFKKLVLDDNRLTFDDLGEQSDVVEIGFKLFPTSAVNRAKLLSVWCRHPNRRGEKRLYIYIITFDYFSMPHFVAQKIYLMNRLLAQAIVLLNYLLCVEPYVFLSHCSNNQLI